LADSDAYGHADCPICVAIGFADLGRAADQNGGYLRANADQRFS